MAPTVVILGAGPGVGRQCILKFLNAGFNVVATSRSLRDNLKAENLLELQLDLAAPDSIPPVFRKLRAHFDHPSVVVYNGYSRTIGPPDDPLSAVSVDSITHDLAVNVTGALIAARQAVEGWQSCGLAPATFIYTGNKLNVMSDPKALSFGMGKTAAAKMIWDCHAAYSGKSYRFYFTDQRKLDGSPAREAMDPEARADLYVKLALDDQPGPWHYTFVKEKGYVDFREVDRAWNVSG